jgi:hypothetical protein
MNPAPFSAKKSKITGEHRLDPVHLRDRKPKVFPQFGRTVQTVEIEHCLTSAAYYVDVRRAMIVRIDDHSQRSDPGYGRHYIINPDGLGLLVDSEFSIADIALH